MSTSNKGIKDTVQQTGGKKATATGEPIHRMREFGNPFKELDLLDEVALNTDQMRLVLSLM